jgi:folate-binding protein YgfZ
LQRLAVIEVDWPGWSGRDVVFAGEVAGLDGSALGLGDVSAGADEAFEAAQIEAGVPKLGSELTDRTIPQEAGDLVAHAVSFTKGCYTGQELVARIDARGSNTPRRLRGLVIEGGQSDPAPAAGDAVVSADGVQVGDVTRAAWSPGQQAWVALGYVKRGTDVPAPVSVTSGGDGAAVRGSRSATVRSLPLFEALVA